MSKPAKARFFLKGPEMDVILPHRPSLSLWCNVLGNKTWYDNKGGMTLAYLVESRKHQEISICEARKILRKAGMSLPS